MKYFIKYPEDKHKYEQFSYPGGEEQVRLNPSEFDPIIEATEIVVIARLKETKEVIGLALLTDAIQQLNFNAKQTLILPYLPYARADRRFVSGDCLGLKVFGNMIDSLGYDSVVTLDVHSRYARKFISNLTAINPIEIIKTVYEMLPTGTTLLLPDEGAKRYELEKHFKNVLYCEKERDPKTGKILRFKLPPGILSHGDDILIVDDICDGGATFNGIAELLPNTNLYLYVTHGIFSKGLTDLSNHFLEIFTTDSFPRTTINLSQNGKLLVTTIPSQGFINDHIFPKEEAWKTACQELENK